MNHSTTTISLSRHFLAAIALFGFFLSSCDRPLPPPQQGPDSDELAFEGEILNNTDVEEARDQQTQMPAYWAGIAIGSPSAILNRYKLNDNHVLRSYVNVPSETAVSWVQTVTVENLAAGTTLLLQADMMSKELKGEGIKIVWQGERTLAALNHASSLGSNSGRSCGRESTEEGLAYEATETTSSLFFHEISLPAAELHEGQFQTIELSQEITAAMLEMKRIRVSLVMEGNTSGTVYFDNISVEAVKDLPLSSN